MPFGTTDQKLASTLDINDVSRRKVNGMAILNNGKDPVEKLKDLHQWLMNNRVRNISEFQNSPAKVEIEPPKSIQAQNELADFKDWLKDIQSSEKPLFGQL